MMCRLLQEVSGLSCLRGLRDLAHQAAPNEGLTVERPDPPVPDGKGSSNPANSTCFRLTSKAAHMPNVATDKHRPITRKIKLTSHNTHPAVEDEGCCQWVGIPENRDIRIEVVVLYRQWSLFTSGGESLDFALIETAQLTSIGRSGAIGIR